MQPLCLSKIYIGRECISMRRRGKSGILVSINWLCIIFQMHNEVDSSAFLRGYDLILLVFFWSRLVVMCFILMDSTNSKYEGSLSMKNTATEELRELKMEVDMLHISRKKYLRRNKFKELLRSIYNIRSRWARSVCCYPTNAKIVGFVSKWWYNFCRQRSFHMRWLHPEPNSFVV